MKKLNTRGFTIIELLIATVTFSVVLLIVTGAIIQFSKIYYRGVATSKTQEVARAIADEVSRAAQFTSESVKSDPTAPNPTGARCIGDKRFSYKLNTVLSGAEKILIADTSSSSACTVDLALNPATDRELMGENMKLLAFDVSETGGVITTLVTIGYGPDASATGCPTLNLGGQFCAISSITSTVTRRL